MRKLFPVLVLLTVLLSSCLPDENECRYKQLATDNFNKHTWAVDSFHVFVDDSITLYTRDTLYLNDGTWTFSDIVPNDCKDSGTIVFNRADGSVVAIPFYKWAYYSPYTYSPPYINLHSPSLDGYTEAYNAQMVYLEAVDEAKIYVDGYGNLNHPKLLRRWSVVLRQI